MREFSRNGSSLPIVCVGISAGGTTAVQDLFRSVGTTTDMAFVVIHHLRQEHPTALVPILSESTEMPVQLAEDGLPIRPNHIYVLPSGEEIRLNDDTFSVKTRSKVRGWPNLVSLFIDSMIESKHPGIAVILSGMDADGAEPLIRLKSHGGIVIAQSPESAICPDMPRAAIKTGAVDCVLDPMMIGLELTEIADKLDREAQRLTAEKRPATVI